MFYKYKPYFIKTSVFKKMILEVVYCLVKTPDGGKNSNFRLTDPAGKLTDT